MTAVERFPPNASLLSGRPDRRGNFIVRVEAETPRVLKVYRGRRGALKDALTSFSGQVFEGKRPVDPAARRETERRSLEIWAREGFSVPRLFGEAPPEWVEGPSLWLELTPGPRLSDVLQDPGVSMARKVRLARALARETHARHRRALELNEPLLLPEHPTTKHVLVQADERLVTIDFEGGYDSGYPVLFALAQELAGVLRSIPPIETRAGLGDRFLDAYGDEDLLESACAAYFSMQPARALRRLSDRVRRRRSKSATMAEVWRRVTEHVPFGSSLALPTLD
ncbi:MAG TPA: hypothetical protein DEA08_09250 [Planctomycetes bacterium]|nr:hypothetical protein [Planctomycetota bacterium]